jgi:hypothetical protein
MVFGAARFATSKRISNRTPSQYMSDLGLDAAEVPGHTTAAPYDCNP